jgi:dihydrofolate reductase
VGGREFADKFNTMPKYVVSSTLRDLADELRLMVFPVVLGTGKRLFGETTDKKRLQLSSPTVVGDGVAIQVYTRT